MKHFVICTDKGFVAYDKAGMHIVRNYESAEPYYSYKQAEIAAKSLKLSPFWILTEGENK